MIYMSNKAYVVWFTGFSGSGKSTIASNIEKLLSKQGVHTVLLDGDNLRLGLNSDLGFSMKERAENIRRVSEVSKLFIRSGVVVIASFISPDSDASQKAKKVIGSSNFIEIFCDCRLKVCENRDVKGNYKQARSGNISNYTGIDSVYDVPKDADIILKTEVESVDESVEIVFKYLHENKYVGQ